MWAAGAFPSNPAVWFIPVVSSHTCVDQHPAECSRKTLSGSPVFSVCSFLLSGSVFFEHLLSRSSCTLNSVSSIQRIQQTLPGFSFYAPLPRNSSRWQMGNYRSHFLCSFCLRDLCLLLYESFVLKITASHILFNLCCFWCEDKSSPSCSILKSQS